MIYHKPSNLSSAGARESSLGLPYPRFTRNPRTSPKIWSCISPQALVTLLEGSPDPILACHVILYLTTIAAGSELAFKSDPRAREAFLEDTAVMVLLLEFCIGHAQNEPMSDLGLVAALGTSFLVTAWGLEGRKRMRLSVAMNWDNSWWGYPKKP